MLAGDCLPHLSLARKLGAGLAAAIVTVSAPGIAVAQEPVEATNQEPLDEIVTTGSRIRRTGFETLQPAVVIDSEQLELRGGIDLATTLNEQAGFAVPLIQG